MIDIKKEDKSELHFYTEYGYVKVLKSEYESPAAILNCYKDDKKLQATIKRNSLRKEINIRIKTLYGKRKVFNFKCNISCHLSVLMDKIAAEEDKSCGSPEQLEKEKANEKIEKTEKLDKFDKMERFDKNSQYRLISSNGYIKELDINKTFIQENIKDNEMIILTKPIEISFSDLSKQYGIRLLQNNKLALKEYGDNHVFAMADRAFSSGRHYVEFSLESEPDQKNIIIGISLARTNMNFTLSDAKNFWGYILSDLNTICNNNGTPVYTEYGDICKMGDKIGILLDFKDNGLDVSFFVNNVYFGVAFKNLPKNAYYPCALICYDNCKVKINNQVKIPDH